MAIDAVIPRLYEAFRTNDARGLLAALAPDFRGEVTAGLPHDLGGTAEGPEAMLREVWGRAYALYDGIRPEPDQFLETTDGRVVVLGWYVGTGRNGGSPLKARFAHVIRAVDGRITELEQITDSARWAEALPG